MNEQPKVVLDLENIASLTPKRVFEAYLLNKPPKVIDRISPSQLGKCHRAHFLKIKHVSPTVTPTVAQLANFEVGFIWEQTIKMALDEQKIPYQFQTHFFDPELNMEGTSDFIIGDPATLAYMWDSKTMASKWFWYRNAKRKSNKFDSWEEDYGYLIQQGCYLLMAKRQTLMSGIKNSTLAYISKDDGFIGEELVVILSKKLEDEIMKRVNELNYYLSHDILPPCTCEGWQVGYCDFGNPNTREKNRTGKMVSTECCGTEEELDAWRAEFAKKNNKSA